MGKKRHRSKADVHKGLQQSFGTDVFNSGKDPPDDKTPILNDQESSDDGIPKKPVQHDRRNPLQGANWISKIFFCWANAIVAKGYKKRLENDDMYEVREKDTSLATTNEFEPYWNREMKKATPKKPPSLAKALIRCYGLRYGLMGILFFIEEFSELVQPILIGYIIKYFQPGSGMTDNDAYMYAGILALIEFAHVVFGYYEWPLHLWGWNMGTALTNLVYNKCLRLSTGGLAKTSTGQVVNILAEDVDAFEESFTEIHALWMAPLSVFGILAYLLNFVGPAVLAGFSWIFLTLIVDASMTPLHIKYGALEQARGDARIDMMDEILRAIRMIKLQAWEKPFSAIISKLRALEMKASLKGELVTAVGEIFDWIGFDPVIFMIILTYVLTGHKLTAEKVFVTIAFLEIVSESVESFPHAIEALAEAKVSVSRVQPSSDASCVPSERLLSEGTQLASDEGYGFGRKFMTFLLLDENQPSTPAIGSVIKDLGETGDGKVVRKEAYVDVDITSAKWKKGGKGKHSVTLRNVKFHVGQGELIVVIGPTGAGKTSLLCTVMRELGHVDGKVDVQGELAVTPQEPWAFPDTIKNNIVDFGKPFDQERYEKAVSVCKMERDIKGMSFGDETYIGDRGVTLSGGQKARLNLARAVYADADIYLMDDPLSAVDAAVGRKLFNKCILGELGEKARILVTHQLQFLKKADKILVLDKGEQVAFGTYEEVAASGVDFAELMSSKDDLDNKDEEGSQDSLYGSKASVYSTASQVRGSSKFEHKSTNFEEEEREGGSVNWRVYLKYLTSGPPTWCLFVVLFFLIAFEALGLVKSWWLAHWVDSIAHSNATQEYLGVDMYGGQKSLYHLKVYSTLVGTKIVMAIIAPLMIIYTTYIAGVNLHKKMFAAVIRAPIRFFDTNPSGRILNRFADDMGEVDESIPEGFLEGTEVILETVGSVILICAVNPWAFLPTTPLVIAFILMYTYYIRTARHLARLDATTGSPVYTHVTATILGLWIIRAQGAQHNFQQGFRALVDRHNEVDFLHLGTESWFDVRIKIINAFYVSFVCFFCIFSADTLGAGMVGLSLTFALSMSDHCEKIVEEVTELEGAMIHTERVLEYSELTPEAPWENDHKPPPGWPQYGAIALDEVYLSYDDYGPPVLKNISLNIVGGEKIGIVGRTGAGKSSLLMMLMRMVEPTGSIKIDGVDVLKMGLHDLRKKISVIPQDPVMFNGTIRKNLDPLDVHSDHTLWTALDEVHMSDDVKELPYRLATEMGKSGTNFSVGQKQLFCLARALLSNNRILLIDEATANMDLRSDRMIQTTIKERFKQCTVVTIAHRLNTVIDSDRILVLAEGRVVEFDEPHVLLTNKDGAFSKLVAEVGESMESELREAAHQSYLHKRDQQ